MIGSPWLLAPELPVPAGIDFKVAVTRLHSLIRRFMSSAHETATRHPRRRRGYSRRGKKITAVPAT